VTAGPKASGTLRARACGSASRCEGQFCWAADWSSASEPPDRVSDESGPTTDRLDITLGSLFGAIWCAGARRAALLARLGGWVSRIALRSS
jgi:hypothetical protein